MNRKNRHAACAMAFISKAYIICCMICISQLKAQDTVSLNAVEIKTVKFELNELGKKTEQLDSSVKLQYKFRALSDALSEQSTVFIKMYGPGSIATTALRGGSAAQTAIMWNGFNVQNSMLGQTDLSLFPVFLFNRVSVEYGGSSSVNGSGAMAGVIQVGQDKLFGQHTGAELSMGMGSFGKFSGTAQAGWSNKKTTLLTKLYNQSSENNFSYKDTSDKQHPV